MQTKKLNSIQRRRVHKICTADNCIWFVMCTKLSQCNERPHPEKYSKFIIKCDAAAYRWMPVKTNNKTINGACSKFFSFHLLYFALLRDPIETFQHTVSTCALCTLSHGLSDFILVHLSPRPMLCRPTLISLHLCGKLDATKRQRWT